MRSGDFYSSFPFSPWLHVVVENGIFWVDEVAMLLKIIEEVDIDERVVLSTTLRISHYLTEWSKSFLPQVFKGWQLSVVQNPNN